MQSVPPAASRRTAFGLAFVALSTLMYEVLLTRIFSVTMWYHFAFVAISVAMFGMTVGALVVYLKPAWFPADAGAAPAGGRQRAVPDPRRRQLPDPALDPVPRPPVDRRDLRDRPDLRGHRRAVRPERHPRRADADALPARRRPALRLRPGRRGARLRAAGVAARDHRRPDGGAGDRARSPRIGGVCFALDEGSTRLVRWSALRQRAR